MVTGAFGETGPGGGVQACPCCGAATSERVLQVPALPVNTTRLLHSRAAALAEPTGELDLILCAACGFLFNGAFDPGLIQLDDEVEGAQGFSPTYMKFATGLAEELTHRYGLAGKRVVEIGCGKGDFLGLLCDVAGATGIGFDPTYVPGRVGRGGDRIEVHARLFGDREAADIRGDLICCMMTLEHIEKPAAFARLLAQAAAGTGCPVVVMVPDAAKLLRDGHFWDFYYEHCSNWSPGTLARLFRAAGLEVMDLRTVYDHQYILIEARPGAGRRLLAAEEAAADMAGFARGFARSVPERLDMLRRRIDGWRAAGRGEDGTVAMWGSGSRATALANMVGLGGEVACFVDINPHRQGTFVPGTGHEIVSPDALRDIRPDTVVVLNPIYRDEIASMLQGLGLTPEIATL